MILFSLSSVSFSFPLKRGGNGALIRQDAEPSQIKEDWILAQTTLINFPPFRRYHLAFWPLLDTGGRKGGPDKCLGCVKLSVEIGR